MQVHCLGVVSACEDFGSWSLEGRTHNDMVAARLLEHVGHKLGSDGSAALVLLVLTCVGEEGDNGGDSLRTRDLASVDHNAKLHERGVDLATAGVDDVDVVFAHRLYDAHMALADSTFRHFGAAEWDTKP